MWDFRWIALFDHQLSFRETSLWCIRSSAPLTLWWASISTIGDSELKAIVQLVNLIQVSHVVDWKRDILLLLHRVQLPSGSSTSHVCAIFLSEKYGNWFGQRYSWLNCINYVTLWIRITVETWRLPWLRSWSIFSHVSRCQNRSVTRGSMLLHYKINVHLRTNKVQNTHGSAQLQTALGFTCVPFNALEIWEGNLSHSSLSAGGERDSPLSDHNNTTSSTTNSL